MGVNYPIRYEEVVARVQQIIMIQLGLSPQDYDPARSLKDLGVDSLSIVEIEMVISDAFGDLPIPDKLFAVVAPDADVEQMLTTIGPTPDQIVDFLLAHITASPVAV